MKQTSPTPATADTPTISDAAVEAFRAAFASRDSKLGYANHIRAGLAAALPLVSRSEHVRLASEAHARLIQQLDASLNGEGSTIAPPLLIDLVAQCAEEARRRGGPVLRTMHPAARDQLAKDLAAIAEAANAASAKAIRTMTLACGALAPVLVSDLVAPDHA
ncbi:hypothetical protein EDF77_1889 [Stenotrophomonas maltophilia]|uniref:hypothetical protein n=1 Tax=Stenotrophomonas chelatiphaga TaxID=517011 RepID=UPI000F4C8B27|nr:hypothetical protein [Stenotrophomonas chelatiphaga]MCS4231400.1 hypothetical protein [Stenotrophomonas chelatiphaga]ROQ42417.1 hypothetical protein EDF77_1889 [Stenotrophomonas maltophilia]